MTKKLTRKEFKDYLCEAIQEIQTPTFLESVGIAVFDENSVKYIPLADGFEVIEEE